KLQLYTIPADGGEAHALTSFKQGVGVGIAWSPDGKMIAFVVPAAAEPPDLSKPYRLTRHVYRFDKVGYVDGLTQDIYTIPAGGGEPRRITNDDCMNASPQWSPDGTELLYLASMLPDSHQAILARLRAVNVQSNQVRDITGDWGTVSA